MYNQSYYPFEIHFFERILAKTGTDTNVMMSRNFFDKLKKPYSNCGIDIRTADRNSIDSDTWRFIYDNKYLYKKDFCSKYNFRKAVERVCNCTLDTKHSDLTLCISHRCANQVDKNIEKDENSYGNNEKSCPFECNTNWIDSSITASEFPVKGYATYLRKNYKIYQNFSQGMVTSNQDVMRSTAKVRLYYDRIGFFRTIEIENMLFIDLISNIGGTISLFLGASLMSFFEIFQIFAALRHFWFKYDPQNNDLNKSQAEKTVHYIHRRNKSC